MATSTTSEETSERKRLSIPRVDRSVLEWWELQHDVGLSVRMLIRAEIERNGYVDTAYQPVTQQPRRGRPPAQYVDDPETLRDHANTEPAARSAGGDSVAEPRSSEAAVASQPSPAPVGTPTPSSFSLDELMNTNG